jgi:hypothetical protein
MGIYLNIGGGYSDTGLSDITLVWMLDKIDKVVESTGIKLDVDNEYIKKYVKPDCTGELRDESDAKTVYKMHKTKRVPFSMTVGGNTAQNKVLPCSDCSYN